MAFVFADKHSRDSSTLCPCVHATFMCVFKSPKVLHTSVQKKTLFLPFTLSSKSVQWKFIIAHFFCFVYSLGFEPIALHIIDKYFSHQATVTFSTPTFFFFPFEMGLAELLRMDSFSRPGSSWTSQLLSSASWVAGMTGLSRGAQQWFPVWSSLFWFCSPPHHANTHVSVVPSHTIPLCTPYFVFPASILKAMSLNTFN